MRGDSEPPVLDGLKEFRQAKDDFFAHSPDAPLTREQREHFKGLAYFPPNPALFIRTALDRRVEPGTVLMETTKGGEQAYVRYGIARFDVDGEPAEVTLFTAPRLDGFFLPLRDTTSGTESYPAGRYLEVETPDSEGMVSIDFNRLYNPYCAYNDRWTCPLPPAENWLKVPLRAGEKIYPEAVHR